VLRRQAAIPLLLLVVAIGGYLVLDAAGPPGPTGGGLQDRGAAAPPTVGVEPLLAPARAEPTPRPAEAAGAADPPPPRPRSRAEVDQKRAEIRRRLTARRPDAARSAPAPDDAPTPVLDKEYIREAIREQLVPVIHDCYNQELAVAPELAGKVVLEFSILGDEEVGGVVDEVRVDEAESTLDSAAVRECMRESMYAVEFPPPPAGGTVMVTYPFVLEPG
jgi:hypothetical protein